MGRDFHSTECVRLLGVSGLDKALTELIKVRASQVSRIFVLQCFL